jgi:SH3-like domain-containing protein
MNWKNTAILLISLMLAPISYAQEINLYEQPDSKTKVVGKADTASGIIPIFKPQSGDWVKVADPRNGNVGWVKQSDINSANDSRTYQIIQYGKQNKMSDAEIQAMVKKMQQQQELLQKSFQNIFNNMNKMFEDEWQRLKRDGASPIMMPIIIMPGQKIPTEQLPQNHAKPQAAPVSSPAPASSTTPAATGSSATVAPKASEAPKN